MRHRKIGTLGNDIGGPPVQKRVLGGDGLPRVGSDGFQSILDAGLDFPNLHSGFLRFPWARLSNGSLNAEPTSAPSMPRGLDLVSLN